MSTPGPEPLVLSAEQLRELARGIAIELAPMLADPPDPPRRLRKLVDPAELAQTLGVSRDTVYAHAEELGGQRIGNGPRGRLRFDLDLALGRWTHRSARERSPRGESPAQARTPPARRRRPTGSSEQLLPVRGPSPITTAPESS